MHAQAVAGMDTVEAKLSDPIEDEVVMIFLPWPFLSSGRAAKVSSIAPWTLIRRDLSNSSRSISRAVFTDMATPALFTSLPRVRPLAEV